ncbi:hypothetical protein [Umezawaea sp. NPDC059074]|uniref:hypothetical protein n=1 Tax=Umezawaea sp. NPDC059074 TaxID=3346716 RepID=UPI00367902CE
MRTALADEGLAPSDVDHVNAHGTSTPKNDEVEVAAIARVLPHGPSVTSAKGVLGHTLGAAGAIEAALTALTLRHGVVPPIVNLASTAFPLDCVVGAERRQAVRVVASHSFGFGGHNVVLVFTAGRAS